ncbi:hypothetical protein [Roseofilum capinflatum]|uniref:Uncharacterized protein n=1 Tax=Roseofilum capinflatum BLCC-M114 TaxID=3022440 RepID=A0ABT7B8A7_9CYAN|nr:hypothetical protein [Roseofilum capinflatum]MDJ1174518.1 hypothetical protein [Roseofilum capinflatum BLCC-M114]
MTGRFNLKPYSYYNHHVNKWIQDYLVIEAHSDTILGFFMEPQPGEVYGQTYDPQEIRNLSDFPEYSNLRFFSIYPHGIEPRWQELGFTLEEALPWKGTAQLKPDVALGWHQAGFAPHEVRAWQRGRNGTQDPAIARRLLDLGIEPEDLKQWPVKPEQILAWVEQGFDPRSTAPWQQFQEPDAVMARQLCDRGYTAKQLTQAHLKRLSLAEIGQWIEQGFDINNIRVWQQYGISPAEAAGWQELNIKPEDAAQRRDRGITLERLQALQVDGQLPDFLTSSPAPQDLAILFWGFDFPHQPDRPPVDESLVGQVDAQGCKVDFYGKPANIRFFYVTVVAAECQLPWRNQPPLGNAIERLGHPAIQPDWVERLAAFCAAHQIPWQEPGWHVATRWVSS